MERNSLQFQLREAQQQFRQTREEMVRIQQARSNSYTETAQMGLHVANLENKLQSVSRLLFWLGGLQLRGFGSRQVPAGPKAGQLWALAGPLWAQAGPR